MGLIPFSLIRYQQGDLIVASIDLFGLFACLGLAAYVLRTRQVAFASFMLAVISMGGMTLIVAMHGVSDIHFLYPVVVVVYFLVRPAIALGLCALVVAALFPILGDELTRFEFTKVALSLLGCTAFAYAFAAIQNRQRDQLLNYSAKDGLTGAGNRRALDQKLQQVIQMQNRNKAINSLIILDLDNFKQVNDELGHAAGDEVLKRICASIQGRIRVTDSLYRYGGDEFVVFVAEADEPTCLRLAEDLRARVHKTEQDAGSNVSISLGIATYAEGETAHQWLARADSALLVAKRSGRNQVAGLAA